MPKDTCSTRAHQRPPNAYRGGRARHLTPDAMAKELRRRHPFAVKKINEQARHYRDIAQLETIYRRLLDIETEIKTEQTCDVLAFDMLISDKSGSAGFTRAGVASQPEG